MLLHMKWVLYDSVYFDSKNYTLKQKFILISADATTYKNINSKVEYFSEIGECF